VLGDALDGVPSRWDRTNIQLAAQVRALAQSLPGEALGAAGELATALDPRPYTQQKFDGLQAQLAAVASRLPEEFQPAAVKIAEILDASAAKIPPPFAAAVDTVGAELQQIPERAAVAGREADSVLARAAAAMPSHFGGIGDKILAPFRGIKAKLSNIFTIASGVVVGQGIGSAISGASQFVTGAPEKAVDLERSRAAGRDVFKAAAGDVEAFSRNASKAIGLSERAALDATTAFGNQFVQLGFTNIEAAKMAKTESGLIADFATFRSIKPEQVIEALQAAQRGEYDSLQRVIPAISAAKIQQEALKETHKKSVKQLTDHEKALAAYNVILQNIGPAQGAFKRGLETGNPAAQLLEYNAQLEDVQTRLGDKLIPLTLKLKEAELAVATFLVDKGIPVLEKYGSALKDKLSPYFAEAKQAAKEFFDGLKANGVDASTFEGIAKLGADIREFVSALVTGKASGGETSGVEKIALAIRDAFDTLKASGEWLINHKDVLIGAIIGIGAAFAVIQVAQAVAGIAELIGSLGLLVEAGPILLIGAAIVAVGAAAVYAYTHFQPFHDAVNKVASVTWELLKAVGGVVVAFVEMANHSDAVRGSLSFVWEAIKFGATVLGDFLSAAGTTFADVVRVITDALHLVTALLKGDWSGAWAAAKQLVIDGLLVIGDALIGLPATILKAASGLWDPLLQGLAPVVNAIIEQLNRVIHGVNLINPFSDIPDIPSLSTGKAAAVVRPTKLRQAASGHVAYRQQSLIVGDNYRAQTDPEIIAPQSAITAALVAALKAHGDSQGPTGPRIAIDKVMVSEGRDLWQELAFAERLYSLV
jgi:hypothetical protein